MDNCYHLFSAGGSDWIAPTLIALVYATVVWVIGLVVGARLATERRGRIVLVLAS